MAAWRARGEWLTNPISEEQKSSSSSSTSSSSSSSSAAENSGSESAEVQEAPDLMEFGDGPEPHHKIHILTATGHMPSCAYGVVPADDGIGIGLESARRIGRELCGACSKRWGVSF